VGEIAAMRARMEHEIGAEDGRRLNLKQGRGGLVDVEFITQMMALRHGHLLPSLRVRATTALIRALADTSLMREAEAESLADDYHFMTRLENRLRIDSDQAAWALPTNHAALTPLARRMAYVGDDAALQLLDELERRRTRVRGLFEAVFAREK
jgi:glutamate-ammonia-ligase adenylyltransferase